MGSSKKKNDQLGMPYGTATSKLRKLILFDLVKKLNLDSCYHCGEKIEKIENFSIEHKIPWLDNSKELFWDLDNISFSHLRCNCGNSRNVQRIHWPEGKQRCWCCKTLKNTEEFSPNKQGRGAKQGSICRKCDNKRKREWSKKKRDRIKKEQGGIV